jgi:hypothetical protein
MCVPPNEVKKCNAGSSVLTSALQNRDSSEATHCERQTKIETGQASQRTADVRRFSCFVFRSGKAAGRECLAWPAYPHAGRTARLKESGGELALPHGSSTLMPYRNGVNPG